MLQQTQNDRSVGELFGDLAAELSTLVRQEVTLAKTEISQKISGVVKDVGMVAAGGVLAVCALLALEAAAILGLATVLPAWAAALIVGVVVLIVAAALVMKALGALKKENLAPQQTIDSLREDAQWLKQQAH